MFFGLTIASVLANTAGFDGYMWQRSVKKVTSSKNNTPGLRKYPTRRSENIYFMKVFVFFLSLKLMRHFGHLMLCSFSDSLIDCG